MSIKYDKDIVFIPMTDYKILSKDILEVMCKNEDIIEDSSNFLNQFVEKLEKELPLKSIKFTDPIFNIYEPDAALAYKYNKLFSNFVGKPIETMEEMTWKKYINNILHSFITSESENMNRQIENVNRTDIDYQIENQIRGIKAMTPDKIKNYVINLYNYNQSLIDAFLLTFIINSYKIPRHTVVYRGISGRFGDLTKKKRCEYRGFTLQNF